MQIRFLQGRFKTNKNNLVLTTAALKKQQEQHAPVLARFKIGILGKEMAERNGELRYSTYSVQVVLVARWFKKKWRLFVLRL